MKNICLLECVPDCIAPLTICVCYWSTKTRHFWQANVRATYTCASAVAMKSTQNRPLATLLDNMRESIHAPHGNLWCLQGTYVCRASASGRGKTVLICMLARSLGFRAVTPERSSFRENPTYFSTFIRRWIRGIVCGAIDGSWSEMACGLTDTWQLP